MTCQTFVAYAHPGIFRQWITWCPVCHFRFKFVLFSKLVEQLIRHWKVSHETPVNSRLRVVIDRTSVRSGATITGQDKGPAQLGTAEARDRHPRRRQ